MSPILSTHNTALCIVFALENRVLMWYNVITMKKKPVKTISKTKPEHRKTAIKPALNELSVKSEAGNKPSKRMSFDKLYRMLYAHPKMVEDLIVNFVKEQFVEHIDFTTLKDCKTKFVTDRDGIRESDMLYELKIKDETVYFYVLLEFQSTVDRFMPLRMLTYVVLFYQDWLKKQVEYKRMIKEKEKEGTLDEADIEAIYETIKLPAVFPILLYNGEKKWSTPSELKELIGIRYKALDKYVPNFRYYKIIENEFSSESLKELESINAALFRTEQASVDEVSECALRLTEILKREADPELQRDFRRWLYNFILGHGIEASEADEIIDRLEAGDMTLLEATIKRNREEILSEGEQKKALEVAQKMLEEGIDVSTIVRVTGLPEAKIKSLAEKPTKEAA